MVRIIGTAVVIALLFLQTSCSTGYSHEAACATTRDQKNTAADARFIDLRQQITQAWQPDIGTRRGIPRTLHATLEMYRAERAFEYEMNELAYQKCLGEVV